MNIVDARKFYWAAPPFEEQPLYRAPADVQAGWIELAKQAQAELERFGLPATVVTPDAAKTFGSPAGALIIVNDKRPFGVTLYWEPPLTGSVEFKNVVTGKAMTSPLFRYVGKGQSAMEEATMLILSAAGFETAKESGEGNSFEYRVLMPPLTPIIERG